MSGIKYLSQIDMCQPPSEDKHLVRMADMTAYSATKTDIWQNIEYSGIDTPKENTRTHYRIICNAPHYRPITGYTPEPDPAPVFHSATLLVNESHENAKVWPEGGSILNMVLQTIS